MRANTRLIGWPAGRARWQAPERRAGLHPRAPLSPGGAQARPASRRSHASPKAMGSLATNAARLVGTLHWGRSWREVVGAPKARERTGTARILSRQPPPEQRHSVEWW